MFSVRLPAGLIFSLLVAVISVGCLAVFGGMGVRGGAGVPAAVHTSAALALVWALAGFVHGRWSPGSNARSRDLGAVLQIAVMATALLAVIVMLYMASIETLCRSAFARYRFPWQVNIWPGGLLDLGLILAAVVLSGSATHRPSSASAGSERPVLIFWLLVFASLWASLLMPGFRTINSPGGLEYEAASAWASLFALSSAIILTGFTCAWECLNWRRRVRAWPDELDRLTAEPAAWSGFRYSAGLVAVAILVVSCVHIAAPWTVLGAFLAGGSLLALAHRRWHDALADTSLALITLGVVAAFMLGSSRPVATQADYASLLNRALLGLAIMTAFWHWLGEVWLQQLDEGRPWTTAGRLISVARRVGFLSGVVGVLVSAHLALWPSLPLVVDSDTSLSRWLFGLAANVMLVLALLFSARRTGKHTLAWLTLIAVAFGILFVVARVQGSPLGLWWSMHWPLVMAGIAGLSLAAAVLLSSRPRWAPFIAPLTYTAVIFAPVGAILGASPLLVHVPAWVPLATLSGLCVVYLLAAVRPGPTTFTAVAAICAVAALWELRQLVGSTLIPNPYFYGTLAGLCLMLVALSYQRRAGPRVVLSLKWMGGLLLLLSVVGGLIAGAA